ncbi:hypothetical protein A9Q86_03430 [Flavobacteriales bacterium 33_180_T64]|nr:hypothetical protein A9Q86_03430 [Flavobacteriales bacterium 33_180_T64]
MKHLYIFALITFFTSPLLAQETITFSGYNGSGSTVSVNAVSNVNQTITIVFEDSDIIQNFYTQFQNSIFMYGGLDTDNGGFQSAPDFNDIVSHPELTLTDGDNNAQPNTYSITINLAQHYTGVPNGTTVYGFNLLFQNQFGGGGNNQTLDFYINLDDAVKDDTLSVADFSPSNAISFFDNTLIINDYQGTLLVTIYDITGKLIKTINTISHSNLQKIDLGLPKNQVHFVSVSTKTFHKTLKVISK